MRRANTRITVSSSRMRISTRVERPTVSIQNGRRICWLISCDSAWSSSEKNGFGPGGGISETGRKSTDEAEPVLRDAADGGTVGILRISCE